MQQEHVIALPKASSLEHLRENLEVFDFVLDAQDLQDIATLPKYHRYVDVPTLAPERDVTPLTPLK